MLLGDHPRKRLRLAHHLHVEADENPFGAVPASRGTNPDFLYEPSACRKHGAKRGNVRIVKSDYPFLGAGTHA
jgi:hypothetical protein